MNCHAGPLSTQRYVWAVACCRLDVAVCFGCDEQMRIRAFARNVTPPILISGARWVHAKFGGSRTHLPVWERLDDGWSAAHDDSHVKGWNVTPVRNWHRDRLAIWSQMFERPRPLGASEYAPDQVTQHLHSHNVHVSFAYVLALAAAGRKSLSVLDWGGGVGQHYILSRAVLPGVEISYSCRDLPMVCAEGRQALPEVTFFEDDGCLDGSYDLVVASNSLQYSERWEEVLERLGAASRLYLYVAQLPTVIESSSFVAVQRPYGHYETEYIGWILNRSAFLTVARACRMEFEREFFFDNAITIEGASERAIHRGFLLRPARVPPLEGGHAQIVQERSRLRERENHDRPLTTPTQVSPERP